MPKRRLGQQQFAFANQYGGVLRSAPVRNGKGAPRTKQEPCPCCGSLRSVYSWCTAPNVKPCRHGNTRDHGLLACECCGTLWGNKQDAGYVGTEARLPRTPS